MVNRHDTSLPPNPATQIRPWRTGGRIGKFFVAASLAAVSVSACDSRNPAASGSAPETRSPSDSSWTAKASVESALSTYAELPAGADPQPGARTVDEAQGVLRDHRAVTFDRAGKQVPLSSLRLLAEREYRCDTHYNRAAGTRLSGVSEFDGLRLEIMQTTPVQSSPHYGRDVEAASTLVLARHFEGDYGVAIEVPLRYPLSWATAPDGTRRAIGTPQELGEPLARRFEGLDKRSRFGIVSRKKYPPESPAVSDEMMLSMPWFVLEYLEHELPHPSLELTREEGERRTVLNKRTGMRYRVRLDTATPPQVGSLEVEVLDPAGHSLSWHRWELLRSSGTLFAE